jgi:hypothetical protein
MQRGKKLLKIFTMHNNKLAANNQEQNKLDLRQVIMPTMFKMLSLKK